MIRGHDNKTIIIKMEKIEDDKNQNELKNENPEFISDTFNTITNIFANYGWFLLLISIGILYIYIKLQPYIERYLKERNESDYSAKYHKDSDLYNERQIQLEKSREKMQAKMLQASREYTIKMEERELKRRQDLEEKYNNDPNMGHRLGSSKNGKNYNPLMDHSSGSSYRAPKRSACNNNNK